MRLKLKIVCFFTWYFFRVKNSYRGVLWEWWFYFCLGFRRHCFRHTNFKILKFRFSFFLNLGLKGVIEKCVGCFLVYLFLGVFFRLKSVKKCVYVVNLKNAVLPVKSVFINVKKGISELWFWLALIHTTKVSKSIVSTLTIRHFRDVRCNQFFSEQFWFSNDSWNHNIYNIYRIYKFKWKT